MSNYQRYGGVMGSGLSGMEKRAKKKTVLARGSFVTCSSRDQKDSDMQIIRSGSQASNKGPADWFTGSVRVDPLFQAPTPARVAGASVTFEPGARTAWHTHPLGQTLIVISGGGRGQRL